MIGAVEAGAMTMGVSKGAVSSATPAPMSASPSSKSSPPVYVPGATYMVSPASSGRPKPKLASVFTGRPEAKNARFKAEDVVVDEAETVDLYLQNTIGERFQVLQIKATEAL